MNIKNSKSKIIKKTFKFKYLPLLAQKLNQIPQQKHKYRINYIRSKVLIPHVPQNKSTNCLKNTQINSINLINQQI